MVVLYEYCKLEVLCNSERFLLLLLNDDNSDGEDDNDSAHYIVHSIIFPNFSPAQ